MLTPFKNPGKERVQTCKAGLEIVCGYFSIVVPGCNLCWKKYVTRESRGMHKSTFLFEQYLLGFFVRNLNVQSW